MRRWALRLLPVALVLGALVLGGGLLLGADGPGDRREQSEPSDRRDQRDHDAQEPAGAEPTDLSGWLLRTDELPGAFADASSGVADTITTICAGQDATAGMRATGRAVAGFRREPPGVSVVQVVLELPDGQAAAFVERARELLATCDGVPDPASGLAFEYEAAGEDVEARLAAAADGHVAARGTSVGSEAFLIESAFFHVGDVAQLVAVLAVNEPLDGLLDAALAAALS
jgi:hypothetical protein